MRKEKEIKEVLERAKKEYKHETTTGKKYLKGWINALSWALKETDWEF